MNKILHGILIGLGACAVASVLWLTGCLDWIEHPSWDQRVRFFGKPRETTKQIKLILLDQSSLDWGEEVQRWSWPWPRTAYAAVLDFCRRGGSRAVVFDVLFTEPSAWDVADDENLGVAIKRTPGAVMSLMLSRQRGRTTNWISDTSPPLPWGLEDYVASAKCRELVMTSAAWPIPEVVTNCRNLGDVSAQASSDKVIRRTPMFHMFDNRFVPSLGLAAYCAANPDIRLRFSGRSILAGDAIIPLDSQGRAVPRYRACTGGFDVVSAQAVIQSEQRIIEGGKPVLSPDTFKSAYVFFAFSAPGLFDLRTTPFDRTVPGAVVHATVLDNILSNDFMCDSPAWFTGLLTLLLGVLAASAGRFCQKASQAVMIFVVFLPIPFGASFAAYHAGFWLPLAPMESAVALALVGAVVANYAIEGRQKRFIKTAFKQYLSPALIERMLERPDQLKLGGEVRELTIFFSDVRGFTSISESLSPDKLTALLNEYLTAMSDIIMDEGGTIDKYEGDAIIAFWNAPLDLPDHAVHGVRAALLCQKRLAEMRPDLKTRYGREIVARIGMNTGPVVVGNMGSHQRFNYTFLGDAGNLASRLEGVNKQFGSFIMISGKTAAQLGGAFHMREMARVLVVGKKEAVQVFEPMFHEDAAARKDILLKFASALQAYYDGNIKLALDQFRTIADKDPVANAYARHCEPLIATPPAQWDGIWEMTEK